MSGGVDSSVAAALLQEQGYEVIGITFQLYDYSRINRKAGKGSCCSIEDVTDARSVCQKLGIKHYLMDSRERFQKRVVNYFTESYKAGKTPNPCVACNTFIKFDELAEYTGITGAQKFATGHYARLVQEGDQYYVAAAKDLSKDQSYFLMGVSQERLKACIFPLGNFTKDEIRAKAESLGLQVSNKPDSQEVCFIPNNNYRDFLKNEGGLSDDPGRVVTEEGEVLANHPGIHYFTVGQKKGLGPLGLHHYVVVRTDPTTKEVVVGVDRSLFSEGLIFESVQSSAALASSGGEIRVKIRSRSAFIPAKIMGLGAEGVTLKFDEPQRAVTPGQFAVVYKENKVLGGGPILRPVATFA